jgi:hypothetical protein
MKVLSRYSPEITKEKKNYHQNGRKVEPDTSQIQVRRWNSLLGVKTGYYLKCDVTPFHCQNLMYFSGRKGGFRNTVM